MTPNKHNPQQTQKIGPNEPCHCGSNKKYKHCHRREDQKKKPASIQTKLSWTSLQSHNQHDFHELASLFLRQQKCPPERWESWLGLAELALENDTPSIFQPTFSILQERAKTPQQWFSLATLAPAAGQPQVAWDLLQTQLPPLSDNTPPKDLDPLRYWSFRAELAWALKRWQQASLAFSSAYQLDPQPNLLWKQIYTLSKLEQYQQLHELCVHSLQHTQQHIWMLLSANISFVRGLHNDAHQLYALHLQNALSNTPKGFPRLERALLQAVEFATQGPLKTHTHSLFSLLSKRSLPDPADLEQRAQLALHLAQWQQLEQDATQLLAKQKNAHTPQIFLAIAQHNLDKTQTTPTHNLLKLAQPKQLSPQTWLQLLSLLDPIKDLDLLLAQLKRLEDPTLPETEALQLVRHILLDHCGQYTLLHQELQRTTHNPNSFSALLWGKSLLRTQQTSLAITALLPLWEQQNNTQQPFAGLLLLEAYLLSDQLIPAQQLLSQIEQQLPEHLQSSSFWLLKSRLAQAQDDPQTALHALTQLHKYDPSPWSLELLCELSLQQNRPQQTLQLIQTWTLHTHTHTPKLYALLTLSYSLLEQHSNTQNTFKQIDKAWLHSTPTPQPLYLAALWATIETSSWLETLSLCEEFQTLTETQHNNTDTNTLREIETLRRRAARGLLQHHTEQSPSPWTRQLRENLHLELTQHNSSLQKNLQQQQLILKAERQHLKTIMQTLSSQPSPLQQLQPQFDLLRQNFLQKIQHATPQEYELLLQNYTEELTQLTHLHPQPTPTLANLWPTHTWMRLPPRARELLQAGEQLFTLMETIPQQDHAPILLQWTRAAEETLNKKIVDPLAHLAFSKLGLHPKHDLPSLGNRTLLPKNNQLSLGSVPYLIAEYWEYLDPTDGSHGIVYNHQITPAQHLLWQGFKRLLQEAKATHDTPTLLFQALPPLCQQWALLRNQAAHNNKHLDRNTLSSIRQQLLETIPNLFTIAAQIPPLPTHP